MRAALFYDPGDLAKHRGRYTKVDVKDPESLRRWFEETPFLSVADRAVVIGRSVYFVRALKRLAGLSVAASRQPPRQVQPRKLTVLVAPKDWDNYEWLSSKFGPHSIVQIAEAVGLDKSTVCRKLQKYGIKKGPQLRHPCDNPEWIRKHYVEGLKTHRECAALAGIALSTFGDWLVRNKIAGRKTHESGQARARGKPSRVEIWSREFVHRVAQEPIVLEVSPKERGCVVRYDTWMKETYWYGRKESKVRAFALDRASARIRRPVPIYEQYPGGLGTPSEYPAHLIIQRREWHAATTAEQRIAVHTLIKRLRDAGWSRPVAPPEVLAADWEYARRVSPAKYVRGNVFQAFAHLGGPAPGWDLVTSHFDLSEWMRHAWARQRKLYRAIQFVLAKDGELSTASIVRAAAAQWGPRVFSPVMYRALLSTMQVRGTVLDLYPGLGHKAMACALLGLRYMTPPDAAFESAVNNGFGAAINLDWRPDDGSRVDLVIADDGFRGTDLDAAMRHAPRARRLLAYVPRAARQAEEERLRPGSVIGVKTSMWSSSPDCLFVW